MIIIFYDANQEKIHVCSPNDKTKVIGINDPNIMDYIPNDDILYVTNGHWMEKRQFGDWLQGEMEIEDEDIDLDRGPSRFAGFLSSDDPSEEKRPQKKEKGKPRTKRYYIHPVHNGSVRIEDIRTVNEPDGIELNGKWDFRAVDAIGEDVLNESNFAKILLAKGKIEVVDDEYYEQHKHKHKATKSPAEQQLDAILIPADRRATDVAADGGMGGGDVAIPIIIDG